MKILHVSHQQMKHLGARNYFLPVKINNGFIRNNHDVYWFSERDVARCSSWLHTQSSQLKPSKAKINRHDVVE